jgi:predicted DNA-binding protein (MmcQ/YjbR family)
MNAEILREWLLTLPHVEETMQWGESLVFWAADKTIGGKMFAVASLGAHGPGAYGPETHRRVLSFAAGPERFAELVEIEGVVPAPYLARAYCVALERWDVFPAHELKEHLRFARELVFAKLPKRTKDMLAMAPAERKKAIAAREKLSASRGKTR